MIEKGLRVIKIMKKIMTLVKCKMCNVLKIIT